MRELKLKPSVQIWVCVNERSSDELPSCQRNRGESVVVALKKSLLRLVPESRLGDIWINRSLCQGSCSVHGVSLVVEAASGPEEGSGNRRFSRRYAAVLPQDTDAIIQDLLELGMKTDP